MVTTVDALYKSADKLILGWSPERNVSVESYSLYVGLVRQTTSLVLLQAGISIQTSSNPGEIGKIVFPALIADVRTALSLPATVNFANTEFFFAVTYTNSAGVESALADSIISEVPPVGITTKYRKDDPTANRMIFGFSEEAWRWVKAAASAGGALITDACAFYQTNTVTEYKYDGTNLSSMKSYLADRTTAGSPAKLVTYAYTGSVVNKVTVSDTTV